MRSDDSFLLFDFPVSLLPAWLEFGQELGFRAKNASAAEARWPFEARGVCAVFVAHGTQARGLALVERLAASCLPVVVVTDSPAPELAFAAGRAGASGFVAAELTPAIRARVCETLSHRRLEPVADAAWFDSDTPRVRETVARARRAAASDLPLLIRGESGTGKGVLAAAVHRWSPRHGAPLVPVNCQAFPETLLFAELFGHARGLFTGALGDGAGRVESAEGGTLFLDEIGDLSLPLQAQLVRFIEERTYERLGEPEVRSADVRVIAATHRDLEAEVAQGRFRLDLFYRLKVVDLLLAPLRERSSDIVPLARHFSRQVAARLGKPAPGLSAGAESSLLAYGWPGNLRELKNEIEQAVALHTGDVLDVHDLSETLRCGQGARPFLGGSFTLAAVEREHLERVLARAPSFDAAAGELGIDPSTLWRKRKRLGRGPGRAA
jgi:NtrC-family two-component system response regulator AlgB